MSAKHTPGPWTMSSTITRDGGMIVQAASRDDGTVWDVAVINRFDEDRDANARLIVEAPAMLEALRKAEAFMAGFEGDDTQEEPIDGDLANMRAIIARVEA